MQQYMLFEQHQRGIFGIMAAAPPPNSNHCISIRHLEVWSWGAWR